MIRTKIFAACAVTAMAFAASPSFAQSNTSTGTASSSSTSGITQQSTTTVIATISGPSVSFSGSGAPGGGPGAPGGGPGGEPEGTGFNFDRDGLTVSQSGASAGGADGKLAVWVNGGYATYEQDQVQIAADGDTYSLAVGADWMFSDRFVGGLSVSGYTSDSTLTFNNGTLETDGLVVAPYFAAILGKNRNFILDGVVGYGVAENDATRANGAISGSYDSDMWFGATNLTYQKTYRNFAFAPKVGILWLDSSNDGYTESGVGGVTVPGGDTQLGRLSAGAKVSYIRNPKFIPYVSATGEYDFETDDYSAFTAGNRPSVEDMGATLGLGANVALSERLSGTLEGTTAVGRDDYSAYSLSGTLRLRF